MATSFPSKANLPQSPYLVQFTGQSTEGLLSLNVTGFCNGNRRCCALSSGMVVRARSYAAIREGQGLFGWMLSELIQNVLHLDEKLLGHFRVKPWRMKMRWITRSSRLDGME